jgi:NTP pyrophosphatase (non-canonical NTP hydrolase)
MSELLDEQHREMVRALAKPGDDIAKDFDGHKAHLMHMLIGLAGEVGELMDALKRPLIYRSGWDFDNIVEELGDIEFYLQGLRQGLSIKREDTLNANIKKLSKRYAERRYTDAQAIARKDKV